MTKKLTITKRLAKNLGAILGQGLGIGLTVVLGQALGVWAGMDPYWVLVVLMVIAFVEG